MSSSPEVPADQMAVRRLNLSLVMRTVNRSRPWSRARIAAETGLNKATVSSLVSELIDRGLIAEGPMERGGLGRPSQIIRLDPDRTGFLGVEINVAYLAASLVDLTGSVVASDRQDVHVRGLGPERSLDRLAEMVVGLIDRGAAADARRRVTHLQFAIPGLVDTDAGRLFYAPNLGWRDIDVVECLRARMDLPGCRIGVDNEANLAAVAEHAVGIAAGTDDLLLVSGEEGVGGGVISSGALVRGVKGFAGEFGHMALTGDDARCGCGRTGCWEASVGLSALIRAITEPDDPLRTQQGALSAKLSEILRRADDGDSRTLAGLRNWGRMLGRGASVLANALNPAMIMFGGTFAALSEYVSDAVADEMRARVLDPDGGARVGYSTLGFAAACLGGAHLGIEAVLADPTIVPLRTDAP